MPQLDVARREARCVIVYHGPRRAGKSETLQGIRHAVLAERRGDVLSVPSGVHPALIVEHLALRVCAIGDLRVNLHLYALPDHEALPLMGDLLRRADGLVFVADSQADRLRADREALAALEDGLARAGVEPGAVPFCFQWNKRDLPSALPAADLAFALGARHRPGYSTVATTGEGLLLPLREVALQVLSRLEADRSSPRRVVALPSFQRARPGGDPKDRGSRVSGGDPRHPAGRRSRDAA